MTADLFLLADETKASVSAVCRTLGVPRSTVYAKRVRKPSERQKETAQLDVAIKAEFKESGQSYGSPRVHRALRTKGKRVGRKRVAARMRLLQLRARRPKRFQRTTQSDPKHLSAPNLLARRFDWPRPNQAWAGDVTYIRTATGWAYLAIMIDLCTRAIVGWAVSSRCDAELTRSALDSAFARHRPSPGLLHHTDRGSTYTAEHYRSATTTYGMVESMSRKGNCWDNAVAESTFSTIKTELIGDIVPAGINEVRHMLFPYIEHFYNRKRLHSSIGYITPTEKESLAIAQSIAA